MNWVLVTGSSGGIGSAICDELRSAGYRVLGIDGNDDKAADLDHFIQLDLSTILVGKAERKRLLEEIIGALEGSHLCALVNNAAVQLLGSIEELEVEDFRLSMDINVSVPLALSQLCFELLEAGRGAIINIGSIHASLTKPGFISYSTSKAALAGLTRALAVDAGNRVRVLGIQPAAVSTAMLVNGFSDNPAALKELESFHPSGSVGTPGDIAGLVNFFLSSDCQFLNGTILDVNGGIGARLHDPV